MMKKMIMLLFFSCSIFLGNFAFAASDINNFLEVVVINNTNQIVFVKAAGDLDWQSSCQSEIPPHTTQRICGEGYIPLVRGSYPWQDGEIYISYLQYQFDI